MEPAITQNPVHWTQGPVSHADQAVHHIHSEWGVPHRVGATLPTSPWGYCVEGPFTPAGKGDRAVGRMETAPFSPGLPVVCVTTTSWVTGRLHHLGRSRFHHALRGFP